MPSSDSHNAVLGSFLSSVQPGYRHPDQTKKDVQTLLHHYKGLAPKGEKFMFNDGRERELLHLVGTIPVPYKGQNYNIPISLTLLDTHPYHAPMAFVKPTPDMQIKVSKHVDASGKIYLPYLHEWSYPTSDLVGLVQICVITFSEQPPVFAKPKQQQNLPYPVHGGGGGYPPQPSYNAQPGYPPAYPPYPNVGAGYPPAGGGVGGQYPPASGGAGPYPPATGGQYPPPYPPTNQNYQQRPGTGTITADHIRASILSAVEDKVKRRLREDVSQAQAEEINPDDAITATNPLFKQLMTAYAEEAATEDAIYFLGEALRKGSLDIDQFLKTVRDVSRKQFMLRATMMKCRDKAGLSQN